MLILVDGRLVVIGNVAVIWCILLSFIFILVVFVWVGNMLNLLLFVGILVLKLIVNLFVMVNELLAFGFVKLVLMLLFVL